MSSRNWVFTINNYTSEDLDKCEALVENKECRYIIWGFENAPTTGTPHMQGYVEFGKVMRTGAACKALGGRASMKPKSKKSTREQARDYCKKGDQSHEEWLLLNIKGPNFGVNAYFSEFGNWKEGGQGSRNDIYGLMDMVKERRPRIEIMETLPAEYAKNMKFAEAYNIELEKIETRKERKNMEVHVIWGDAGAGKTYEVWEKAPEVFKVNPDLGNFAFDGYDGEKDILLDDFYGNMKYTELLQTLHGYQHSVNVKYGRRYAKWTRVFITSNKPPAEWYSFGLTPALARRLTSVKHVTKTCNEEGVIIEAPLENVTETTFEDRMLLGLLDNIL